MVDISTKPSTQRKARAEAFVRMRTETVDLLRSGAAEKGDVFAVARVAGIMAMKKTADLLPLAHPLCLTHAEIGLRVGEDGVFVHSTAATTGSTGVEMEALTGASVAALTIYDMAKKRDRGMAIEYLRVVQKSGGASGEFSRPSAPISPEA